MITNQAVFAFYKYGPEALTLKQLDEVERLGLWADDCEETECLVICITDYKLKKGTQIRHTQ